jgi:hypothetical protein
VTTFHKLEQQMTEVQADKSLGADEKRQRLAR